MPTDASSSPPQQPEVARGLWAVTWPLLLSYALSLSLNFVDALFLSRVSDQAAAGGGAVLPVLGATFVAFSSISLAGCSVASQLMGARRHRELPVTYGSLLVFNLGAGVLVSLVFLLLHRQLPVWLGLEGETAEHAATYLGVLGSFQFLRAVQLGFASILNSRGETRWVLAEALLTNVANVGLNLVFLNGAFGLPPLGVAGIALATVVSLAIGLAFTVTIVRFKLKIAVALPSRSQLREPLKRILRIGIPSALEPVSYQCAQMVTNLLIIGLGTSVLAARVYVFNCYLVTTMLWSLGFGIGTQILVAHRIGAGDFVGAQAQLLRGLYCAIAGNLGLALLLAVIHPQLMRAFTSDPAVLAAAAPLFFVAVLVEIGRAINIVCGGALRSSGDARYTSVVGGLMMWTVGVPACFLFGHYLGYGLTGVWLGMALDELSRGYVNYRRWQTGDWQRFAVAAPAAS